MSGDIRLNAPVFGRVISDYNEGKLVLRAFFVRLPDDSTVLVRYYLLGGDTAAPSWLYAGLCHAFLVSSVSQRHVRHNAYTESEMDTVG